MKPGLGPCLGDIDWRDEPGVRKERKKVGLLIVSKASELQSIKESSRSPHLAFPKCLP